MFIGAVDSYLCGGEVSYSRGIPGWDILKPALSGYPSGGTMGTSPIGWGYYLSVSYGVSPNIIEWATD